MVAENQDVTTTERQAPSEQSEVNSKYCSGFRDCIKEVFHCLTNVEAMDLQQPCFQRLMCHLQAELQFLPLSQAAKSNSLQDDNNQQGIQQSKCLSAASNVGLEKSSLSKSHHETRQCKRSYESISKTATQQEASSSENYSPKRVHIDDSNDISGDNGLYAQGNDSSLDTQQSASSLYPQESDYGLTSSSPQGRNDSRKENPKVPMGMGSVWVANGTQFSQMASANAEKEKVQSSGSRSDKANVDSSGNEGPIGNNKLPNSSPDIPAPIVATPISPRMPYIPNPYTAATYALHPSGTHYIPVLLHLNIPVPLVSPPSDMSGFLNSAPNGYLAGMNCMRMGGLQYPYVPCGMPFVPHVPGGVMGMNGIHNVMCKQEPETQKQCRLKCKKEVDSTTTVDDENISDSVNVCSTTDKLY